MILEVRPRIQPGTPCIQSKHLATELSPATRGCEGEWFVLGHLVHSRGDVWSKEVLIYSPIN